MTAALGYVPPGRPCPPELWRQTAGAVDIVLRPEPGGRADRLSSCLAIQAVAGAVLPFAPHRAVPVGEARTLAARAGARLADRLAALDGRAEMLLHMALPPVAPAVAPAGDGRGWLRQRQAVAAAQARALVTLRILADHVPAQEIAEPGGPVLALLVPGGALAGLAERLRAVARTLHGDGPVRVIAPCPPFHFAGLAPD